MCNVTPVFLIKNTLLEQPGPAGAIGSEPASQSSNMRSIQLEARKNMYC